MSDTSHFAVDDTSIPVRWSDPFEVLPDFDLDATTELVSTCHEVGLRSFHSAVRHVRSLPYGRNSERLSPRNVLVEGRGTCSTKHALLARLARRHGVDVELRIGIYPMREDNTPGVGRVLEQHELSCVPEAHCYLAYESARVDVTGLSNSDGVIERMFHEEPIQPRQIGDYKRTLPQAYHEAWAESHDADSAWLWNVREQCIGALAAGD